MLRRVSQVFAQLGVGLHQSARAALQLKLAPLRYGWYILHGELPYAIR